MKRLIIDMSPIFYSNLISSVSEAKKSGVKKDENGIVEFDERVLIFKIMEELATFKNKYQVNEVILAFDNSKGGYWRKSEYGRYKYGRKEAREKSEIDWNAGFKVFEKITNLLSANSSFVCLSIPTVEADDIAFVLSEHFSKAKEKTILYTIDKDWIHALNYPGVEMYRSRKTQRKEPLHEVWSDQELKDKAEEHCVIGDLGDGFRHIKSWTQFSDEFLEEYPRFKGKELELYDKHPQIESMYDLKHNWTKSAYKHPRFGWKSYKKGPSLDNILDENPIHRMNYELNKKLCLPLSIPTDLKESIISEYQKYHKASKAPNYPKMQQFFLECGLFELNGMISNF